MKRNLQWPVAVLLLHWGAIAAFTQLPPPGRGEGDRAKPASSFDTFSGRLLSQDRNGDGAWQHDECTDKRLLDLFRRADADHDNVVTKQELKALYDKESAALEASRRGPGGRRPPGGGPMNRPPRPESGNPPPPREN